MPIYEFVCESCGRLVESLQKLTDPPPDPCPECGGKMAKIMSRNSFQLKGGGWYKDLYSSSGGTSTAGATSDGKAAAPATPAADKPAEKPAAKADAPAAPAKSEAKAT
jgi:putative FmdB family regulatory protein